MCLDCPLLTCLTTPLALGRWHVCACAIPCCSLKANRAKGAKKKAEVRLTRRERDELEAQEAARLYQKKHAAGMTDEAKADKARLAVVRQRRADAAKKKEEEAAAKALAGK